MCTLSHNVKYNIISVKLIIIPVTINMYRKQKSDELNYAALFEKENDYDFS